MAESPFRFTNIRTALSLSAILFLIVLSVGLPPARGASDSELFQKGVSSFQKGNFPAAIQSLKMLLEVHPKTPLRDMTLYYLARAYVRGGNRDLGASTATRLMQEYPATYNRQTIDSDLLKALNDYSTSRTRQQNNPPTAPSPQKPTNATPLPRQGKNPQLPSPSRLKEPKATTKAAVSPPRQKTSQKGTSPASLKIPQVSSPNVTITAGSPGAVSVGDLQLRMASDWITVEAGKMVSLPFTLTNLSSRRTRAHLRTQFPPLFSPRVISTEGKRSIDEWLSLGPKESFRGSISLTIPGGCTDGARFEYPLRIVPESSTDKPVIFPVKLLASAPYLRGTVRAEVSAEGGRTINCTVTIINAGSLAADDVTVRIVYPRNTVPVESALEGFGKRGDVLTRDGLGIGPGQIIEVALPFTVAEEVANGSTFRVDIFDRKLNTMSSVVSLPLSLGPKGVDIVSRGN